MTETPSSSRQNHPKRIRRAKPSVWRVIMLIPVYFVRWLLKLSFRLIWKATLIVTAILGLATLYYATTMPELDKMLDGRTNGSVTFLDRDGEIYAWRGDQRGSTIRAKAVSPHLKNAIIATEDRNFFGHFGISIRGIASAIRINLNEGRSALSGHGGSTLTQQVAKLVCLGTPYDKRKWKTERAYENDCRKGSLWRKIREALYAVALEIKLSKHDILTIYLNRAYLGSGSYGFDAAAQQYFAISATDVNPAQSAMLAGMLTAPSRFAPTNNLKRAQDRAATVLRLMNEQGYLNNKDTKFYTQNPATLSKAAKAHAGGYFADWIMSDLPPFLSRKTTEDVIIKTTLDPRIQKAAENGLEQVFNEKVMNDSEVQAAIVVMSADGAVRAMVGGRETRVTGVFNRATQAKRQTGSAFKPFVYAAALDMGAHWDDIVVDEPLCLHVKGSGEWCPKNYSKKYAGPTTLTDALAKSLNIPAVKVSENVGREAVRAVATMFGIDSNLATGPALALGVSEGTLLETTGAYAGILNGGSAVTPYGLETLTLDGDNDPLLSQNGGIRERVISRHAARELTFMMNQVIQRGTGRRAQIDGIEIAGKTGTSQSARDAWFIGFTSDYVVGVWMGHDDNQPMKGVTGGGLPAEIWHEVVSEIHTVDRPNPLPMNRPENFDNRANPPKTNDDFFDNSAEPTRPSTAGGNLGGVVEDALIGILKSILGHDN